MKPYQALLLVGPTGSGKTPLGAFCEKKGLWGTKVFHFDFGATLRRIAETGAGPYSLAQPEVNVIRHCLETGALLENENFHIAQKIILTYAGNKKMRPLDLLLLNGFPRHIGQARDMGRLIHVNLVVALECRPDVVFARIQRNSGGDRLERTDDTVSAIENKLKTFRRRTVPLLSFYRRQEIPIKQFKIKIDTTPQKIYLWLNTDTFSHKIRHVCT